MAAARALALWDNLPAMAVNTRARHLLLLALPLLVSPLPSSAQPAPAAAPAAPAGLSMDEKIAQLQQLGELQKAGILTDEEFAAQKAKILNS